MVYLRGHNIGRGSKMSIAKAALIVFYTQGKYGLSFFDYGELDLMHKIIDVAGAQHRSFFTPYQVMSRLRNSPYWDCEFCPGFYSGFRGHGGATIAKPSEKGKLYYNKFLKDQT